MATLDDHEYLNDQSDLEADLDISTPDTTLSAAATPKKQPKCRDKHLECPYPDCDKTFNRPARLEEHKRSHTNERIFQCPEPGCTKDFLRKTHLKRHIEANHTEGQKTWVCKYDDCGQSFVTNQRLKRHHAVHEKRDQYRCPEPGCSAEFRKHNTLDQHIRTIHRGESAFPCDEILQNGSQCPRGFANAHYLKLHKGRDHGAKSYFCTLCPPDGDTDNSFGTYSDFQAHNKLIHPPTCATCGYTAKSDKEILLHIQSKHSGDTLASRQTHLCPFPACGGKGFVEQKNLKLHIKTIHEDAKPFACGDESLALNHVAGWDITSACGRAFSHKANLENHIRTIHMGLESMQKQRILKRKASQLLSPNHQTGDKGGKQYKPSALSLLTGTSMTHDPRRTIPCPVVGCDFTFIREWDQAVHLQSKHGIPMDDEWIMTSSFLDRDEKEPYNNDEYEDYEDNDMGTMEPTFLTSPKAVPASSGPIDPGLATAEAALEAEAAIGGQFWVGGLDSEIGMGMEGDAVFGTDYMGWDGFGGSWGGDNE